MKQLSLPALLRGPLVVVSAAVALLAGLLNPAPAAAGQTDKALPVGTVRNHWSGEATHHVVVQSWRPDKHNYDATSGYLDDLKVGWMPLMGTFRAYVELDISGVSGTSVRSATLRTRVNRSFCDGPATELWLSAPIGPDTTWRNQPERKRKLGATSVSNNSLCPSAGGVDFDVTRAVAKAAASGKQSITVMLKAAQEYRMLSWREFDLNPTLQVVYNSYPGEAAELTTANGLDCVTGDARPALPTRTPRLRATVADPDGGLVSAGFRLYSGPAGSGELIGEYVASNVPSGSVAEVRIPKGAITEDGVYHWSVWTSDGQLRSDAVGACEFAVDTTAPAQPTVSSQDDSSGPPTGDSNNTMRFTVSANGSGDVAYFQYWFTGGDRHRVKPNEAGVATIEWTPTMSGPITLWVRAWDDAGNRSATVRHFFFA